VSYHAEDAEASVVGAAFLHPSAVERSGVQVEHLTIPRLRIVWGLMLALRSRGEPIDTTTVSTLAESRGVLDDIGGFEGVADLAEMAATHANVEHHGAMVVAAHAARRARDWSATVAATVDRAIRDRDGAPEAVVDVLAAVAEQALSMLQGAERSYSTPIVEALRVVLDEAHAAYEARRSGAQPAGTPWGMPGMDRALPMADGALHVIMARTGSGKTASLLTVAHTAASTTGRHADFFTSEVDAVSTARRYLAHAAKVDAARMLSGHIDDGDIDRLLHATRARARIPLTIWDRPDQSIEWIASMVRLADSQRPEHERGGVVVIDYYQRLRLDTRARLETHEQLAEIARRAQALALRSGRPVLMGAQLRPLRRRAKGRHRRVPRARRGGVVGRGLAQPRGRRHRRGAAGVR